MWIFLHYRQKMGKALQVLKEDKLAHKLWTAGGIQLNPGQTEAIERAVTNCFQLIQGPPGMLECQHL